MVQSVCNFKRNALEMHGTPIANVIVKLNLKGKIGRRRASIDVERNAEGTHRIGGGERERREAET